MKKISIIMAAYNQEKFIGRCLRSLIQQKIAKENYEIIVINDGSNDKTAYALELFGNAIKILTNEKNIGLPASINRGIRISNSEYIVRVDADDYVNENFLNFLSHYLDTNQDAAAVACDYILVDDDDAWIKRVDSDEAPIACGIMFRRKSINDVGLYDETFKCHEDKDLRIRFEAKYRIDKLKIPLYRYRRHALNLTNNNALMEEYEVKLNQKHNIERN